MLGAVGDVVDDVVVRVLDPIRHGTDTPASITRRRGGSAANVATVAARLTGRARFLGQVGDDATADLLLGELDAAGVDTAFVRRAGRSGSIVVLVDAAGERSFLTDPGDARRLDRPDPAWLDSLDVLHVPFYSLVDEPLATTATTLIGWARERGIAVSIDASSVSVLDAFGVDRARSLIDGLAPGAVFANADEARLLGIDSAVAGATTFVKHGAAPAVVHAGGTSLSVPAIELPTVSDTTGAGDAFAAGVLTAAWRTDPESACAAGHAAAADLLRERSVSRSGGGRR